MLALAWRNVMRQRVRTIVTLGTIAFGVAGLVLSGGFVQDMFSQLADSIVRSQTGHVQLAREGYFEGRLRSIEASLIDSPEELAAIAAAPVAVTGVARRLNFAALLNNGVADAPVLAEGVEVQKEASLARELQMLEGRPLKADDLFAVNVGEGVARRLRLSVGNRANVVVASAGGAMNVLDFEVVGIFRSFSREYDTRAIRVPLQAAQELLDTRGANLMVVSAGSTAGADAVRDAVRAAVAGRDVAVRSWHELDDFYPKTVELYERQFGVLRLIILVMVMLGVVNTVNMSVNERIGEFGTMRALGNRSAQVFRLVMAEGLVLGLLGAAIGAAAGVLLGVAISAIGIPMPPPPNSNLGYVARIELDPGVVALASLTGLAATILGSIAPALRVARATLVDSLRQYA